VDKWKNARLEHPKETTEYVAAVALPDAASAMFLTTLTTAVAFFATAICPVAPIKMFAIFCGLLIIFDYVMNILLVFPALCIYDKVLMSRGGHAKVNWCITCTCCGYLGPSGYGDEDEEALNADAPTKQNVDNTEGEEFKPSLIRRILLAFYDGLHYIRWPLLVVCMVAIALTVYFASTLELPTSSDFRLLDESNQFELHYIWSQNLLAKVLDKAGGSQAYVIWGVKPADTGDQSKFFFWKAILESTYLCPRLTNFEFAFLSYCRRPWNMVAISP
jgi:predicted RND superfamily exporter protein